MKPNRERAIQAQLLLWIILCLEICRAGFQLFFYLATKESGHFPIGIESSLTLLSVIMVILIFFYVLSAYTFISWLRRAYHNLHQKVSGLSFKEEWATFAWFVPILSIILPFNIIAELYDRTRQILVENEKIKSNRLSTNTVTIWWILWVASGLYRFTTGIILDGNMGELDVILELTGYALSLIATGYAIKVVRNYSAVEKHLLDPALISRHEKALKKLSTNTEI